MLGKNQMYLKCTSNVPQMYLKCTSENISLTKNFPNKPQEQTTRDSDITPIRILRRVSLHYMFIWFKQH